MKTQHLVARSGRMLQRTLAAVVAALLLVMGALLASVLLPPVDAPAHVLYAPAAASVQAPGPMVTGTLASFTALFPDALTVYLPAVAR